MKLLSVTEALTYGTVQQYDLATPAMIDVQVTSGTYVYRRIAYARYVRTIGTLILGAPLFAYLETGVWTGRVDDDYDGSYMLGSGDGLIGASLFAATGAAYGWMQTGGPNLVALTTDGTVGAGYLLVSSGTDGTWAGVTSTPATITGYSAGSSKVAGVAWLADSSTTQLAYTVEFNACLVKANSV